MSQSDAGKGSANTRDYDRRAYWDSPLWKQKKKNQDIWDANQDKLENSNVTIIKTPSRGDRDE